MVSDKLSCVGISGGEEYLLPSSEITRFDVRTPMLPDEDMETLMVDPVEPHDWYLVEKDHDDGTSNVYRYMEHFPFQQEVL